MAKRAKLHFMEYPLTDARQITLPNGLTIILAPESSAPVISVQAWVATGSVHEGDNLGSGLSHFLEHMVFKGTRDYTSEGLAQAVQAGGGHWNAYTTFDRTVYYIDGPAASLEVFLKCLSGLIFHPLIPESEFEGEKDVIRREIDMGLDDPDHAAMRLMLETMFKSDARRHPVIGHRHLFDEVSYENLTDYHRRRYTPDRVHYVISGDFNTEEAKRMVAEFTADARSVQGPEPYVQKDAPQLGKRAANEEFDVPTSRLTMSWKVPALDHPDAPAYDLLAAILGRGKSSRLHVNLRDGRGLAMEISAWTWIGAGTEGVFGISAESKPELRDELQEAILGELTDLAACSLEDDLAKAKRQIAKSQFSGLLTASGRATDLGSNWHEAGDLDFTRDYLSAINAVNAADIRRVAANLRPGRLTATSINPLGFVPLVTEKKAQASEASFSKFELSNGLRVILLPDHRVPLVYFQAAIEAGLGSESTANNGLNTLFAEVLTQGTIGRTGDEISLELESLGASISASTGNNALLVQAQGLAVDSSRIAEVFCDTLENPSFNREAIERERISQIATLEEALADPLHCCFKQVRRGLFGAEGYGLDALGTVETLGKLGRLDLAAHHARHFNAQNLVLAVSGDFDVEKMKQELEALLAKFPKGEAWTAETQKVNRDDKLEQAIQKRQAVLAIGWPGAGVSGEDRHALAFIQEYASDMAGPLFMRIREELGLAYRVGATQFLGRGAGAFMFYLATSPEQLDLAQKELEAEIEKIAAEGIPVEAFERVRATVISGSALRMQSPSSNARHAALDLLFGQPADHYKLLPAIYGEVTPEQVQEVAGRYFKGRPVISRVAPEL